MSTVNMQFIALFVKKRKELGLTQKKAASECGVSERMWGMYERGETMPGIEALLKFQGLGADVADLFEQMKPAAVEQFSMAVMEERLAYIDPALSEADKEDVYQVASQYVVLREPVKKIISAAIAEYYNDDTKIKDMARRRGGGEAGNKKSG